MAQLGTGAGLRSLTDPIDTTDNRATCEGLFPRLRGTAWRPTSPAARSYNCIGWAAGDDRKWWWPGAERLHPTGHWPEGVRESLSVQTFEEAYGTKGYEVCDSWEAEAGYEKVAIYAEGGEVRHAARQLDDGSWTSKLGRFLDIVHVSAGDIGGDEYGEPVAVLRRAVAAECEP